MLPRDLLTGLEHREVISRLLDLGDQALQTWEVVCSDFLSPSELIEAQQVFKKFTEVKFVIYGGYAQAERCRMAIAHIDLPLEPEMVNLAAIDISGNFLFDPASHRDFLGAILGTGIERQKVGDLILLGEKGAQVIVVPELVEYLSVSLNQVRTVPVKVRSIELANLKIRPPQTKEIATVEASLRLDAIASAGFGMSRSKMVDFIDGDDVRVNWKSVTQPSYQLKSGDLVAVSGKGRLAVGEITVTKKNRYRVLLTRFL
ncbi:photosystem II S4 domain protein [Synechococcus sp. PCC 7502]|uniref:photosystem II S4 domain protein n=1 Tax=Synechococcus sp. PCC 7502 TaxID=1173263 RepID=UPI00029FA149|nr:photosystem II S4 domain protein [Synechococcus sp. PCC 7502]AFY72287.1 photosystem II S4 domain protein [Synechococcus sp. PCC 7502]